MTSHPRGRACDIRAYLSAAFILVSFWVVPAFATPIQVGNAAALASFKITSPDREDVKDFHIVFEPADSTITGTRNGVFPTAIKGAGQVDWISSSKIKAKTEMTLGVRINSETNEVRVSKACWTGESAEDCIANATLPGFTVKKDPEYTIYNDLLEPFGIRDLQFLVNVPEIPFDTLDPFTVPGFGFTQPDFILLPGASMLVNVPGTLAPGMFMYAQGQTFSPATGAITGSFIQGHQAVPVPDPTTFVLVASGLVSVRFMRTKTSR